VDYLLGGHSCDIYTVLLRILEVTTMEQNWTDYKQVK